MDSFCSLVAKASFICHEKNIIRTLLRGLQFSVGLSSTQDFFVTSSMINEDRSLSGFVGKIVSACSHSCCWYRSRACWKQRDRSFRCGTFLHFTHCQFASASHELIDSIFGRSPRPPTSSNWRWEIKNKIQQFYIEGAVNFPFHWLDLSSFMEHWNANWAPYYQ